MTIGQKVKVVLGLIIGVVVVYLFLLAVMPAITALVNTANTSLSASANMTSFPGTAEAVNSFPWYVWFIPGGVGIAAIIGVLRMPTK